MKKSWERREGKGERNSEEKKGKKYVASLPPILKSRWGFQNIHVSQSRHAKLVSTMLTSCYNKQPPNLSDFMSFSCTL